MTWVIRAATDDDEDRVMAMALRFLRESWYGTFFEGVSVEALRPIYDLVMDRGALFVADVAGQVVGMIAVIAGPHPFTHEPFGDEQVWWVEPDYRRGRLAWDLLDRLERWAAENGVEFLKMSDQAGAPLGRLLEHRGYRAVETAYVKRIAA